MEINECILINITSWWRELSKHTSASSPMRPRPMSFQAAESSKDRTWVSLSLFRIWRPQIILQEQAEVMAWPTDWGEAAEARARETLKSNVLQPNTRT